MTSSLDFDPNISVKKRVVLVVARDHPRLGQIGKVLYHDWMEYGSIRVKFADGHKEEFYDGLMEGGLPSKIEWFYRYKDDTGIKLDENNSGPETFKRRFLALKVGSLERLTEQYYNLFKETLP